MDQYELNSFEFKFNLNHKHSSYYNVFSHNIGLYSFSPSSVGCLSMLTLQGVKLCIINSNSKLTRCISLVVVRAIYRKVA